MAPSKEFAKKNLVIVALITWSTEVWTKINEGNQKKKKKARSNGEASQDSQNQKASNPPGLKSQGGIG